MPTQRGYKRCRNQSFISDLEFQIIWIDDVYLGLAHDSHARVLESNTGGHVVRSVVSPKAKKDDRSTRRTMIYSKQVDNPLQSSTVSTSVASPNRRAPPAAIFGSLNPNTVLHMPSEFGPILPNHPGQRLHEVSLAHPNCSAGSCPPRRTNRLDVR